MSRKIPLEVGATYGRLTIICEMAGLKVLCDCACGKKGLMMYRSPIRVGTSVSCGCVRKERAKAAVQKYFPRGRYGKLTVIGQEEAIVICDCDCGTKGYRTHASNVGSGRTKSCGCGIVEAVIEANRARMTRHGMHKTTEYKIWQGMKRRCLDPSDEYYHLYGGRGINVCDEWINSFEAFYADMGPRPKGLSIDRKDNDGPYSKDNCRWATREEQSRNTRRNRRYVFHGEELIIMDAARKYGMQYLTLWLRLNKGMSPDEAVTIPLRRRHTRNG